MCFVQNLLLLKTFTDDTVSSAPFRFNMSPLGRYRQIIRPTVVQTHFKSFWFPVQILLFRSPWINELLACQSKQEISWISWSSRFTILKESINTYTNHWFLKVMFYRGIINFLSKIAFPASKITQNFYTCRN